MAKTKTVYFCRNCGYESPKWLGKCPSCAEWNTFTEEKVTKVKSSGHLSRTKSDSKPVAIGKVDKSAGKRIPTGDEETDRVLGGGMVPGSVILVAGEPGIGKSTLLLQLALEYHGKVLYVSGEESKAQIADRAERIGALTERCYLLTETDPEAIVKHAEVIRPDFVVVDSVQTLNASWIESSPGTISQIRESAANILRFAKEEGITVFMVGHITKEGNIAGPKVMEHMVDTVMFFEGDQNHVFRLLRCTKNRFGNTHELGIFRMEGSGLKQVKNPSEFLMSGYAENLSGSAAASIMEGIRPLIIEVQALVSSAVYGTPQRSTTGFDVKRLNMLLAVLEKRCGFKLGGRDVFLNIAGGMKVNDPSVDLAVVAAVLSSGEDLSLPRDHCFAGEVGLSGEIRPVNRIEQRVAEAAKLGFKTMFVSKYHEENFAGEQKDISIISVGHVREMLREMFG